MQVSLPNGCVFCGSLDRLTREHVVPDWLRDSGLPTGPSRQTTGPLNRSPHELGEAPAFSAKVRDVCGKCNNGWMSALDATAKGALMPLLLGAPGRLSSSAHAGIAAWTQKIILVAMLVSSKEQRANGYGVPPTEYRELYTRQLDKAPLTHSQIWIGRHRGTASATACATPFVIRVDGLPGPELPHGYVMTVTVGQVLLQGVRFTSAAFDIVLRDMRNFGRIWPTDGADVAWPVGDEIDDGGLVDVNFGRNLRSEHIGLTLGVWRPATDLSGGVLEGDLVRQPTPCEHHVYYPATLLAEAARSAFYAFVVDCECGRRHLVETQADALHFKAAAKGEAMTLLEARYAARAGDEVTMHTSRGNFRAKRLHQPGRS